MGTEISNDTFRTSAAYSVLRRFYSSIFSPKAALEVQRLQPPNYFGKHHINNLKNETSYDKTSTYYCTVFGWAI